jgi:hypothetical protein
MLVAPNLPLRKQEWFKLIEQLRLGVSLVIVKLLKLVFVLGVLGLWLGATNHCLLEQLSGFEFLVCASQGEAESHQDGDCSTDSCATVENATYKTERTGTKVPAPVLILSALVPSLSLNTAREAVQVEQLTDVPELSVTWQFSFRTALPPRAPSLPS